MSGRVVRVVVVAVTIAVAIAFAAVVAVAPLWTGGIVLGNYALFH